MKKIISLLLCLCLMGAFFVTPVWADEDTEAETEPVVREPGQCGEDLYWSFAGGALTITGSGKMDDFEEGAAPWAAHKSEIKSVVLQGVTYIGANAFRNYDALTSVDFGSKLYEIGPNAFRSCDGLTSISLPASFKVFGESSFMSCPNLKQIHCAGRFPSFRQNSMWDTYVTIYYPAEKPWSASTIEELETAFKGRIEFLASDGKDPIPNEPEETQPVETEPVTEPEQTEPVTEEPTTQPADVTDTPTESVSETQEDIREEEAEDAEEDEEEEEDEPSYGIWIGLTIVAAILVGCLLGKMLMKPKGRYSGRR